MTKAKYHITDDGLVKLCTARDGNCPYSKNGHFDTPEEAEKAKESIFLEEMKFRSNFEEGIENFFGMKIMGNMLDDVLYAVSEIAARREYESNYGNEWTEAHDHLSYEIIEDYKLNYSQQEKDKMEGDIKEMGLDNLFYYIANYGSRPISMNDRTLPTLEKKMKEALLHSIYWSFIDQHTDKFDKEQIYEKIEKAMEIQAEGEAFRRKTMPTYLASSKSKTTKNSGVHKNSVNFIRVFAMNAAYNNKQISKNDILEAKGGLREAYHYDEILFPDSEEKLFNYGLDNAIKAGIRMGETEFKPERAFAVELLHHSRAVEFDDVMENVITPALKERGIKDDEPLDPNEFVLIVDEYWDTL